MLFLIALAVSAAVWVWTKGMSHYRYVRLGSAISAAAFSICAFIFVILPNIALDVANAEPTEQARVVATFDKVRPGTALMMPNCSQGEIASIKLMPAKIALMSGGGNWSSQKREGDWLVVFEPADRNSPPLLAPLEILMKNDSPIISAQVLCSTKSRQG